MMNFPSVVSFIVSVDLELSPEPEWSENASFKACFSGVKCVFHVPSAVE